MMYIAYSTVLLQFHDAMLIDDETIAIAAQTFESSL